MKRLIPYVICALAFHAIILSNDFSWLKLAHGPTPAARSLSITLSADQPQNRKSSAAARGKVVDNQLQPALHPKPSQSPAGLPAPLTAKETAERGKALPAPPPKNIVKETRRKTSLKALTRNIPPIKTDETAPSAPVAKRHVPHKARTKIFSPSSSASEPYSFRTPADTHFIKKTRQQPDGASEPTTTAAVPPATQIDETRSGAVLKIARPLYRQNSSPPYPRKARRMGYEGIVMLKVLVDENGRVDNLMLLQSCGYTVLDRAALSSVKKWLFMPGTEGGIKKKMWVKIPIRFQLE